MLEATPASLELSPCVEAEVDGIAEVAEKWLLSLPKAQASTCKWMHITFTFSCLALDIISRQSWPVQTQRSDCFLTWQNPSGLLDVLLPYTTNDFSDTFITGEPPRIICEFTSLNIDRISSEMDALHGYFARHSSVMYIFSGAGSHWSVALSVCSHLHQTKNRIAMFWFVQYSQFKSV